MARLKTGSRTAEGPRSIGGLVWPTLRLFILTFNACLILNLIIFQERDNNNENQHRQQSIQSAAASKAHTIFHQQEGSLLSQCDKDTAFDLRNERHRNHKSPFDDLICSRLPLGATAASLWQKYAEEIFQASLHPSDKDKVHAPWTKDLLELLTPHLLQRGLRQAPNHKALQKVMTIIQTKLKDPDNAPPLEVAVVGGSVTEGSGCDKLHSSLNFGEGEKPVLRGQICAWPYRLQLLLDAMLGEGIIRIHNLAVGGTNSGLAIPVLDYWLFPQNSPLLKKGPDVILNGYAANDNLPGVEMRGEDANTAGDFEFFYDKLDLLQNFIRTSIQSRPCQDDPLVLFVDEYLGNQHNFILGEMFRFEAVDLLTDWYGTAGAVSSAQVVRRLIYANTNDEIFTANWKDRRGQYKVDVHFGMPGHNFIALTVAYSMLTMALDFCEEETSRGGDQLLVHENNNSTNNNHDKEQEPHDIATKFVPANVLKLVEQEIPPILDANLQVKDVATQWRADAVDRKKQLDEFCSSSSGDTQALPCSFAFVAAPMGTVRNAGALNGYLKEFTVKNDGWNGEQDMRNGWQNKLGYVATKPKASVLFRIDKTPNKVKTIILHSLKSYGEKWEGSNARFSLSWKHEASKTSYNTTFDIEGSHNQTTSISYPFVLDLADHTAEVGSTLDIQIDLIGGTTFKINAMMMCSR